MFRIPNPQSVIQTGAGYFFGISHGCEVFVFQGTPKKKVGDDSPPPSNARELVGGIPTPLKNMKVSWDDYSQYVKKIKHVPNHQSVIIIRTEGFPLPKWIVRGSRYQHIKENHGATINKQIFQGNDSFTKVILRIVATSCTSWQLLGNQTL